MAILKGIEVTVQVNGQALQEYHDDMDENEQGNAEYTRIEDGMPYQVTKHVEATSGARFTINTVVPTSVKQMTDALSSRVLLDGCYVEKQLMPMRLPNLKSDSWNYHILGSHRTAQTGKVLRPFMFNELRCSGNEVVPRQMEDPSTQLGSVVVKFWRRKLVGRCTKKGITANFVGSLKDLGELDKEKLEAKNLTHSISLGVEEEAGPKSQYCHAEYMDGEYSAFAIFTFRYCSKGALQKLFPLEDRPEEELTMEELREVARILKARVKAEQEANIKLETVIKQETEIKLEEQIKLKKEIMLEKEIKLEKLVNCERGIKRAHDEEIDELPASATPKKVKGRIAPGEIIDLSD